MKMMKMVTKIMMTRNGNNKGVLIQLIQNLVIMDVIPGFIGIPQKMLTLKYLLKRSIFVPTGPMVNQII